jgi:hypothetical protein
VFSIDRAGRVFEPDHDPIAVLQADGAVIGRDDAALGIVGLRNASLPGNTTAWLTVGPQGEVIRYDEDGDRHPEGGWSGCETAPRTCTLVTHLIDLEDMRRRPRVGVGIGIGLGFGR